MAGFARISSHAGPPSRFPIVRTIGKGLEHPWNKTLSLWGDFQQLPGGKAIEPSRFLERAMGIEPTSEAWEASTIYVYIRYRARARSTRWRSKLCKRRISK